MIVRSDALKLPFRTGTAQLAVTSPPYFEKVVYGDSGIEHGHGKLDDYIQSQLDMAAEVARVLDDEGVFFYNIGSTFAGSGGGGGDHNEGGRKDWKPKARQQKGAHDVKGNQDLLVPFRLALAFQQQGWLIRRTIVWSKAPHVKPEDVKHVRRPLDQHEHVFMMAKTKRYRYRPWAHRLYGIPLGDVWEFAPERSRTGHQAPFPTRLPFNAIMLCSKVGDRVLDPYVGSGTTMRVAESLGRIPMGADLYAESGGK